MRRMSTDYPNRVRELRQGRGWSLTRLSGLTGIAAGDIGLIERGLRPAYPGWRRRIADALGLPEGTIFRRGVEPLARKREASRAAADAR